MQVDATEQTEQRLMPDAGLTISAQQIGIPQYCTHFVIPSE
ncbi:MAG TPA: hypothetical protein V6D33_17765 [Cyanophyceae cyanobacterium]